MRETVMAEGAEGVMIVHYPLGRFGLEGSSGGVSSTTPPLDRKSTRLNSSHW